MVIAQNGYILTWTNPVSGVVTTINVPTGQVTATGGYVPKDLTRKFNRIDDRTIEMVTTRGGRTVTSRYALSPDGRTMTEQRTITDAGGATTTSTFVYEKQG